MDQAKEVEDGTDWLETLMENIGKVNFTSHGTFKIFIDTYIPETDQMTSSFVLSTVLSRPT